MKSATMQLIEMAERLNMTGVIGDGTVAQFHELASRARIEQQRLQTTAEFLIDNGAAVLDSVRPHLQEVASAELARRADFEMECG